MVQKYTSAQRKLLELTKCSDIGIPDRFVGRLLLFDIRSVWDLCEYLDRTEANRSSWMQEVSVYRDRFLRTIDEHGDTISSPKTRRVNTKNPEVSIQVDSARPHDSSAKQKPYWKSVHHKSSLTLYSDELRGMLQQIACVDLELPPVSAKHLRSLHIHTIWDLCVYLDSATTYQTVKVRRLQRIRDQYVQEALQKAMVNKFGEGASTNTTDDKIDLLKKLKDYSEQITPDQRVVLKQQQCDQLTVGTHMQTLRLLNIETVWDLITYLLNTPMPVLQWKTTATLRCVMLLKSMNPQSNIDGLHDVVSSDDDLFHDNEEYIVTTNLPEMTLAETLPVFLTTASDYLAQQGEYGARDWATFCGRYGLHGQPRLTLEESGKEYGITRERVRQTEQRIFLQLSKLIHGRYVKNVDRNHASTMLNIGMIWRDFLGQWTIVRDDQLQQTLQQMSVDYADHQVRGVVDVIMTLFEATSKKITLTGGHLSSAHKMTVWTFAHSTYTADDLNVIEYVHKYLITHGTHALSLTEIVDGLNMAHAPYERFTPELIEIGLSLCDSVQKLENGKYEIQICYLSRTAQAERILSAVGEPMLSTDIVATINAQQPTNARPTTIQNLVNQMTQSELFVPIGKSGKWALTSMNVVTDSVINLMQQAFRERNSPASDDEIYQYVLAQRPVSENSIKLYLSSHRDVFIQLPQNLWALKEWHKEGMIDLDVEIPRYIQQYMHSQHQKMMYFHEVRDAVAEYFQMSKLAATHRIKKLKTVQVVGSGERKFILINGNVSREDMQYHRRRPVENQIHEQLRTILELQPSRSMLLTDVSSVIFAQTQRNKASVYAYIDSAQFIEKCVIEHNVIVCVLKEYVHNRFEYIEAMIDNEVRAYILRAITALQQRNARMCIQMLHRRMQESMLLIAHRLGVPDDGVTAETKYGEWFTVVKTQEIHVSIYTMQYLLRIYSSDDFTHKYSDEQVLHHLVGLYINVIVELDALIQHLRQTPSTDE